MSDAAQSRSHLMTKMRGAFQQQNTPVSLQKVVPHVSAQPAVQEPQQPVLLSTAQRLDVLDKVLTDVQKNSTSTLAQPVQELQQVVPQVSPQQPIQTRQQNMGMIAQATPTAVNQAVQQQQALQAAQASGGLTKESTVGTAMNSAAVETGSMVQYVEQEPSPEISPEVSEYLQHVEDHSNQQPQEIVVGEQQQQDPLPTNYPKQAVVVLPITPEIEKQGSSKGPLESVRWLVEWSRKLIKMFSGTIIYREVDTN